MQGGNKLGNISLEMVNWLEEKLKKRDQVSHFGDGKRVVMGSQWALRGMMRCDQRRFDPSL